MSKKAAGSSLSVAVSTVLTVSLANIAITSAAENPFSMKPLSGGYMLLAEGKCGAGKGGEGKCGIGRMDTDGDGKVTREEFMQGHEVMFDKIDQNSDGVIDMAEREAHLTKMQGFMKDGKCGEGKCGGNK